MTDGLDYLIRCCNVDFTRATFKRSLEKSFVAVGLAPESARTRAYKPSTRKARRSRLEGGG